MEYWLTWLSKDLLSRWWLEHCFNIEWDLLFAPLLIELGNDELMSLPCWRRRLIAHVSAFNGWLRQIGSKFICWLLWSDMMTMSWGCLSLLDGVVMEEIHLVIGVKFIYLVIVLSWLSHYVLLLLMTLAISPCINFNKDGCVHHNNARLGFQPPFWKK